MLGTKLSSNKTVLFNKGYRFGYIDFDNHVVQITGEKQYFYSNRYSQFSLHPDTWLKIYKCHDRDPGLYTLEFVVSSEQRCYRIPLDLAVQVGKEVPRMSGMRFVIPVGAATVVGEDGKVIRQGRKYERHNERPVSRGAAYTQPATQSSYLLEEEG